MNSSDLAERFLAFATEVADLPLYRRICLAAADDPDMLSLVAEAPAGQRRPNLLLAAVHDLLLEDADHDLARWYPTVSGGAPAPPGDPYPRFVEFVTTHADAVLDVLRNRATQTNEVNRSCLWWVGVRAVSADLTDRPIALVELGASAGLNLLFDRYAYDWGVSSAGDTRLRCEVHRGRQWISAQLPEVTTRVGIDASPVLPHDERELRWLKACLWPEQLDRHRRFDAALDVLRAAPPTLIQGDLVDELPEVLASIEAACHVVVVSTWVLTYLRRDRRARVAEALDAAATATGRPISWISAEGAGVVDWVPHAGTSATVIGVARWRDGRRHDIGAGTCHPHLAWLDWHEGSELAAE